MEVAKIIREDFAAECLHGLRLHVPPRQVHRHAALHHHFLQLLPARHQDSPVDAKVSWAQIKAMGQPRREPDVQGTAIIQKVVEGSSSSPRVIPRISPPASRVLPTRSSLPSELRRRALRRGEKEGRSARQVSR